MTNAGEWRTPEEMFWYPLAPRQNPRTPPNVGVFDNPTRCIKINAEWWSHVSGVIDLLSDPDAWTGTEEEKAFAEYQINRLLAEESCGMEDIRVVDCVLEKLVDGEWIEVADLGDCAGGGSGGAGAMKIETLAVRLEANTSNATTNFSTLFGFLHTPTYSKMLVICDNIALLHSNAGGFSAVRLQFNGVNGLDASAPAVRGQNLETIAVSDRWENLTVGEGHNIVLQFRSEGTGTATCNRNTDFMFTIIEYDNPDALYVQDMRISGGELQKKIGGSWIDVTDSLEAILSTISTTANNALTLATSATTINANQATQIAAIQALNTSQSALLVSLDTRVDNLEADMTDVQLSVAQLSTDVEILSRSGVWAHTFDFSASNNGFSGDWASEAGMLINAGDSSISKPYNILHNQVSHVCIYCKSYFGTLPRIFTFYMAQGSDVPAQGRCLNDTQIFKNWHRVKNQDIGLSTFQLNFSMLSGAFSINRIDVLGRGDNPFA